MKAVLILLIMLFMYSFLALVGILSMIYGWGINPINWWWIIGNYVLVGMVSIIPQTIKALVED